MRRILIINNNKTRVISTKLFVFLYYFNKKTNKCGDDI